MPRVATPTLVTSSRLSAPQIFPEGGGAKLENLDAIEHRGCGMLHEGGADHEAAEGGSARLEVDAIEHATMEADRLAQGGSAPRAKMARDPETYESDDAADDDDNDDDDDDDGGGTLSAPCLHLVCTLSTPCLHLVYTCSTPSLHLQLKLGTL